MSTAALCILLHILCILVGCRIMFWWYSPSSLSYSSCMFSRFSGTLPCKCTKLMNTHNNTKHIPFATNVHLVSIFRVGCMSAVMVFTISQPVLGHNDNTSSLVNSELNDSDYYNFGFNFIVLLITQ